MRNRCSGQPTPPVATRSLPSRVTRRSACSPSTASGDAACSGTGGSGPRSTGSRQMVPERRWQASIPTARSPARGGCVASTTRPWSSCRSPEMPKSVWSTQQLAEFLAAVSSCETEASAALAAVERAAEALDADIAAIVCGGDVVAAVGYAEGAAPAAELISVAAGGAGAALAVPGVGTCPATGVALEHPPGATLV